MKKVLLLNASYEPLNICSWKRAVVLILKGKAIEVEDSGKLLRPDFKHPTVIRLRHYIHIPHKTIPLSRKNLLHRDKYTCQYCGKRNGQLTIDHIMPRSRGGKDEWENMVVACHHCNVKKGNRTPQEANFKLSKKPVQPNNFPLFELSKQWSNIQAYNVWKKYLFVS